MGNVHRIAMSLLAGVCLASPAHADPAPATRPAARVLLLPFVASGADQTSDAIGRGVRDNLLAELARVEGVEPVTVEADRRAASANDSQAALTAARAHDARFVVYGSYQIVGGEVRLTGVIVYAPSAAVVGGVKATGPARDLFDLEDLIAAQCRRRIAAAIRPDPPPDISPAPDAPVADRELGIPAPRVAPYDDSAATDAWNAYRTRADDWTCFGGYGYANYAYVGYGPVYGYGYDGFGYAPGFVGGYGSRAGGGPRDHAYGNGGYGHQGYGRGAYGTKP